MGRRAAQRAFWGTRDRPLVSADYVNDPRSSIVDGLSTMVVNGTQLKVYAWYDNELGLLLASGRRRAGYGTVPDEPLSKTERPYELERPDRRAAAGLSRSGAGERRLGGLSPS